MSNIKTPGVSVQEVATLPASVAPVATAIPAFVGVTETAADNSGTSLVGIPTRITSLVQYERFYGVGPDKPSLTKVVVDESNGGQATALEFGSAPQPQLYESMKLYFANGGGPCYILSVGLYTAATTDTLLLDLLESTTVGFPVLKQYDEPTLIVIPDGAELGEAQMGALYKGVLAQCAALGDRFALIESLDADMAGQSTYLGNLGNQYLKYGAVYNPRLRALGQYDYTFPEITTTGVVKLSNGTTNGTISTYDTTAYAATADAYGDYTKVAAAMAPPSESSWAAYYDKWEDETGENDKIQYRFTALGLYAGNILKLIDTAGATTTGIQTAGLFDYVANKTVVDSELHEIMKLYAAYYREANDNGSITVSGFNSSSHYNGTSYLSITYDGDLEFDYDLNLVAASAIFGSGPDFADDTADQFQALFDQMEAMLNDFLDVATETRSQAELTLRAENKSYASIQKLITDTGIPTAATGAIAGIYAAVDRDRGVWKAPANVSVTGITGPTRKIDDAEQGLMNVPTSGKAVNAIRTFNGIGHMVWGARTLAGNDNEWRYVSVRRFYNFVEESVAKATSFVVFEPNDANTWTKVKAMIENFLNGLWREGALAGASAEDAYFVRVGLNETMTAQNILEGEMIVEIGMAAVRPAEFIVLKFSHKMQES